MWRIPAFILFITFLISFTTHANAAPVYVAKDSRVYHHDRNCSNITTTEGLMEFSSYQKAEASGGILCEHCDPSAVKESATPSIPKRDIKTEPQKTVSLNEPKTSPKIIPKTKKEPSKETGKLFSKDKLAYDLENYVIKPDDLPAYTPGSKELLDNKKYAEMCGLEVEEGPDDWLHRFDEWGMVNAYFSTFVCSDPYICEGTVIAFTCSVYKSASGASKAFRMFQKKEKIGMISKEFYELRGHKVFKYKTRKISSVGNESMMIYLKTFSQPFSIPLALDVISILWRREEMLCNIDVMVTNSVFFESKVIGLAELQDKRIQQQREKNAK